MFPSYVETSFSIDSASQVALRHFTHFQLLSQIFLFWPEATKTTSMTPILYHVPTTISSPIVQALAELGLIDDIKEKGRSCSTSIQIETLTFADLKTPEHLHRNPMGTSPTLVDSDQGIRIWESGAIVTYLLERYDVECQLHIPSNTTGRAIFLHLQQYIVATVYPLIASLFIHTLKPENEQDAAYLETAKNTWRTLLAPTLCHFLGENPYFMGKSMTVIDLLAAKPMNNVMAMGMLKEFPTLYALFLKIRALPSFEMAYNNVKESHRVECRRSLVMVPGDPQ
jgi:glutathione S-transferase